MLIQYALARNMTETISSEKRIKVEWVVLILLLSLFEFMIRYFQAVSNGEGFLRIMEFGFINIFCSNILVPIYNYWGTKPESFFQMTPPRCKYLGGALVFFSFLSFLHKLLYSL